MRMQWLPLRSYEPLICSDLNAPREPLISGARQCSTFGSGRLPMPCYGLERPPSGVELAPWSQHWSQLRLTLCMWLAAMFM